jgi:SAM-dependent methyltransferase
VLEPAIELSEVDPSGAQSLLVWVDPSPGLTAHGGGAILGGWHRSLITAPPPGAALERPAMGRAPEMTPAEPGLLVLHLRPARLKAREVAVAEVVALLRDLGARPAPGGPLAEARGVAWASVPAEHMTAAAARLSRLGYCEAVEVVEPPGDERPDGTAHRARWRRREVVLRPVYSEPDRLLRRDAPDRRTFLLECGDGVVRPVTGYRGGHGALEHRALPVVDARLLVNLVHSPTRGALLDPYAGAGGVVLEALRAGWSAVSVDSDPSVRFGLAAFGAKHFLADATALPLGAGSVDAVATEPPYHHSAEAEVSASIAEMARVLRPGGRASLLVAAGQLEDLAEAGRAAGFQINLVSSIDRKGTEVACLAMTR